MDGVQFVLLDAPMWRNVDADNEISVCFDVGGAKGLKVYHLESGKRIRDYQYNDEVFFNVHTNGRFLIISDISGDNRNVFITLDIQEFINEKICNKGLWMMEQKMTPVHSLIHVGSSKTKILVANEGN